MYLSKETFQTVIATTPLISIDLLVKNSQGEYLLGYRNNKPAQGHWFVPGGRILKNEAKSDAFFRLIESELGVKLDIAEAKFLGVFEHFYDNCVFADEISTHYIVLGYTIMLDIALANLPRLQHSEYKWFSKHELLSSENVHVHSKWYINGD
jgi:colanic acid biosynthesis protein WcaH